MTFTTHATADKAHAAYVAAGYTVSAVEFDPTNDFNRPYAFEIL